MAQAGITEDFRVYWIPGCSSCLKLKEFMKKQEIPFVSINALEHKNAREELEQMGCKGFPVLAQGNRFVIGQTLEPVIAFLKRDIVLEKLTMPAVMERMFYFLDASARLTDCMPKELYEFKPVPGRSRTMFQLAFHCVQVIDAFIETVELGNTDLMSIFETLPPSNVTEGSQIITWASDVRDRLEKWWAVQDQNNPRGIVSTFYGDQSIFQFAERSTWHCAQHVRQLQFCLGDSKVRCRYHVNSVMYEGLPIPEALWA